MKSASIICSGTLVALISLPSFAQQPNPRDKDKTRTTQSQGSTSSDRTHTDSSMRSDKLLDHTFMDLDKDGRVSKSEFEQAFAKLDTNSDGYISSDEMRKGGSHSGSSPSSRGSESSRDKDSSPKSDSTQRP